MKVLTVVGARPQFIKAAAVSRELARIGIPEILVHTGQHHDENMSDVFFDEMQIRRPDYNLEVSGLNHGAMTGRMLEKLETVLLAEHPDWALVYGDTNSTLAGALAASKLHIPVAHVEAGLRSFEMRMPEEINRIITDRISNVLFCPTQTAVDNLKNEGFGSFPVEIIRCGDVMYDTLLYYRNVAQQQSTIIKREGLSNAKFVLATLHRAENTDDPQRLQSIVRALNKIHQTTPVVLPLHPRTRGALEGKDISLDVHCIDPVGYFDMLALLDHCSLVMTDSGGLQKEAFLCRKNCVTLRDQTEWTELVAAGANILVGASSERIERAAQTMLQKPFDASIALYGDGHAAQLIAARLQKV